MKKILLILLLFIFGLACFFFVLEKNKVTEATIMADLATVEKMVLTRSYFDLSEEDYRQYTLYAGDFYFDEIMKRISNAQTPHEQRKEIYYFSVVFELYDIENNLICTIQLTKSKERVPTLVIRKNRDYFKYKINEVENDFYESFLLDIEEKLF